MKEAKYKVKEMELKKRIEEKVGTLNKDIVVELMRGELKKGKIYTFFCWFLLIASIVSIPFVIGIVLLPIAIMAVLSTRNIKYSKEFFKRVQEDRVEGITP